MGKSDGIMAQAPVFILCATPQLQGRRRVIGAAQTGSGTGAVLLPSIKP